MIQKILLTDCGTNEILQKPRIGCTKFWVCKNTNPLHGAIKFRVGGQVIPKYKPEEPIANINVIENIESITLKNGSHKVTRTWSVQL